MTDTFDPDPTVRTAEAAGVIDAVLEGGPLTLPPEVRNQRVLLAESKVKICHYGGYEHFERDSDAGAADGVPVVFRWTGRTRIAE